MSMVTTSVHIAASPEEVWNACMDPENTRKWVTIVRDVGPCDPGPLVPGYRMVQKLHLRGATFKVQWTLVEVDAPHFARWEGKGPARSKAIIEDRLTAVDGGTRFDYRNEFKAPLGPLGAVASRAVVGGIPEKEANASLARLKAQLERSS
jgi:uncharacterized protein YndB with AHSA1/START domain